MQKGLVIEHIQKFRKTCLKMEGIPDDKLMDIFIGTLKDNIQHEECIFKLTSLERDNMVERKVESKNLVMATRRETHKSSRESNLPSTNLPQPTRLTPQQLEERR